MPSNRHNLTLDEQSFRSLLSAAFTIQEYNDRRLARQTPARQAEAEAHHAPEADRLCQHCGALMPADVSRCGSCGLDEFRPGERVQPRASMWLMSQEQDLGAERPPEIREGARNSVKSPAAKRRPRAQAAQDFASNGFLALPVAKEAAKETITQEKTETIHDSIDARTPQLAQASTPAAPALSCSIVSQTIFFREIVQQALQATDATGAAVALELQGKMICRAAVGDSASEIGAMINTGSGFTGVCASSGTMQLCSNTMLDSRVDAGVCRELGVSAIIVLPLLHQDQLLGLIAVFSRRPYAFGARQLQALQDLAEKFTANLQLSAESANANTGHESPGAL
jgi:L-methionine (R)-S-oxide reductase